jgi:hypothetical protein
LKNPTCDRNKNARILIVSNGDLVLKKFMILYLAPMEMDVEMMKQNPEQMKKGMEPWNAWYTKFSKFIVDLGMPLAKGLHLDKDSTSKSKLQVTGYTIIQADDLEAAKAMVKDHPHYMTPQGSIEIFEMMPMT